MTKTDWKFSDRSNYNWMCVNSCQHGHLTMIQYLHIETCCYWAGAVHLHVHRRTRAHAHQTENSPENLSRYSNCCCCFAIYCSLINRLFYQSSFFGGLFSSVVDYLNGYAIYRDTLTTFSLICYSHKNFTAIELCLSFSVSQYRCCWNSFCLLSLFSLSLPLSLVLEGKIVYFSLNIVFEL